MYRRLRQEESNEEKKRAKKMKERAKKRKERAKNGKREQKRGKKSNEEKKRAMKGKKRAYFIRYTVNYTYRCRCILKVDVRSLLMFLHVGNFPAFAFL